MAQFLAAVPVHGLDAILEATGEALAVGKPSAEHVLNLLTRLKERHAGKPEAVRTARSFSKRSHAPTWIVTTSCARRSTPQSGPAQALGATVIGIVAILTPGGSHVG